jgi:ribosomal protein L16
MNKKKKKGAAGKGNRLANVKAKLKYSKYHRNLFFEKRKVNSKDFLLKNGKETTGYNEYFFFARKRNIITCEQVEACVKMIKSCLKDFNLKIRKNKLTLKLYPDIPKTEKGTGVRMGKGKGTVENWVRPVEKGKVLFSVKGIDEEVAKWIEKGLKGKTLLNIGRTLI